MKRLLKLRNCFSGQYWLSMYNRQVAAYNQLASINDDLRTEIAKLKERESKLEADLARVIDLRDEQMRERCLRCKQGK